MCFCLVAFFWCLTQGVQYFVNKKQIIEKIDDKLEEKKQIQTHQWSPIEIIPVRNTRYYSIVKTIDSNYFLIKHTPLTNVFKKIGVWKGYRVNLEFVNEVRNSSPKSYSLLIIISIFLEVYFLLSGFSFDKDPLWLKDQRIFSFYSIIIFVSIIIGYTRVRRSIRRFEIKYQITQKNFKSLSLKIQSKQACFSMFSVIFSITLLIMVLFLHGNFLLKVVAVTGISEEVFPRLLSSIGKERKEKSIFQYSSIQKYLYGEESNWTDTSSLSEINNDYREEI